jgi:tight adherence protein B
MALLIAALVFVAVFTLITGAAWVSMSKRRLLERLETSVGAGSAAGATILKDSRVSRSPVLNLGATTKFNDRLAMLVEQAGFRGGVSDLLLICLGFGVVGMIVGLIRPGGVFWALLLGVVFATLPLFYVMYLRQRRILRFQGQFPDALDMMTRSIRAGHALSAAIRTVGDEMPTPMGEEFASVAEEVRLGLDPAEALYRLEQRIPTEDVTFFCSAIRIQRMSGGNLAEILDRLAEVIRERFKLLSHARVLSSQHRFTAIGVGASPLIFAIVFEVLRPGYFEPLLSSPYAPLVIGAGVALELIGFLMVWKMATIKV